MPPKGRLGKVVHNRGRWKGWYFVADTSRTAWTQIGGCCWIHARWHRPALLGQLPSWQSKSARKQYLGNSEPYQ